MKFFYCVAFLIFTECVFAQQLNFREKGKKHRIIFNILSYGAKGDGATLDTEPIQKAIDDCSKKQGGIVLIPVGKYLISTINLYSHVTLKLEKGALFIGSLNVEDYQKNKKTVIEAPRYSKCIIYAEDANDIHFEGEGEIDGRGSRKNFSGERPMLVRLVNCKQITFEKLSFKNPASWGIYLYNCKNIHFNGISIDSKNNNSNNDGIDLDGCEDVIIENCKLNTGDDAICPKSTLNPCKNIVVKNCNISSETAGFKLGTSSFGGFENITVKDCFFHDCPMGVIKLLLVDGGRMQNITLSNLKMENVGGPIFIRLGNRGRTYNKPTEQIYSSNVKSEGAMVGFVKGIFIKKIKANVTGSKHDRQGIFISGIPGYKIENISLKNVNISFSGDAFFTKQPTDTVPEDISRYPEQYFFGILPSWGVFVRHVDGLVFKNVNIKRLQPDTRSPSYFEDTLRIQIRGLKCKI